MAQNGPFEFPAQLRELAERNVEQGRAAYAQFMDAMMQATNMWMGAMPANELTAGFKSVQERGIRFAKQNADACMNLATELANAKNVSDVIAIQSRFAQSQMQTYTQQAQELGRLMTDAARNMQPKG